MVNPLRPVEIVLDHLKKNKLVAPRILAIGDYVRISLGTPGEFWYAWDQMPPTGKMAMQTDVISVKIFRCQPTQRNRLIAYVPAAKGEAGLDSRGADSHSFLGLSEAGVAASE
jgi:hypothetical protein